MNTTYDRIPYPQHSYGFTHPDRLATLAMLHGMSPAPIENCRVLELGCASGSNLIPMAYALPRSEFVGLDSSQRQIAVGQQFVEAVGLTNIRLLPIDIRAIDESFGQFDYIIAPRRAFVVAAGGSRGGRADLWPALERAGRRAGELQRLPWLSSSANGSRNGSVSSSRYQ